MKLNHRAMKQAEKLQQKVDNGIGISRRERIFLERVNQKIAIKEGNTTQ